MGVGSSACKGFMYPQTEDPEKDVVPRQLTTVTRLPFLSAFEDRPPFKPEDILCERDISLLKALTHHRTPFAVVEATDSDTRIIYASGGCVAGMGMPVESIEGTSFGTVMKKGIHASQADVDRLEAAIRANQVRRQQPNPRGFIDERFYDSFNQLEETRKMFNFPYFQYDLRICSAVSNGRAEAQEGARGCEADG